MCSNSNKSNLDLLILIWFISLKFIENLQTFQIGISFNQINFKLHSTIVISFNCLWLWINNNFHYFSQAIFRQILRALFNFFSKLNFLSKWDIPFNFTFKIIIIILIIFLLISALSIIFFFWRVVALIV